MTDEPFEDVRRKMKEGTQPPCFLSSQLEAFELEQGAKPEGERLGEVETREYLEDLKSAAASIYLAGQETTSSTLMATVLALLLFPEVQSRAQAEVDALLRSSSSADSLTRLPEWEDREKLPYVTGLCKEVTRWHPVVPFGIPHRLMENDVYRGWYIPKGTLVFANALSMARDPSIYSDPDLFKPERYLPVVDGGLGEPHPVGTFGFGRRICPGRFLAEASIWIVVVSILATFDVVSRPGEERIKEEDVKWATGLTSVPEEFRCMLKVRGEKAKDLIEGC